MEVRRSLLCPVCHCPHHGPGPLLPLLWPHSYTAQLPPEATTSVVRLNKIKPPMQWRGYKPTTHSSEGICAYTQPLLVERLNLSSRLIHAVTGIWTHDPQRDLVHALACTTTATWTKSEFWLPHICRSYGGIEVGESKVHHATWKLIALSNLWKWTLSPLLAIPAPV